MKKHLILILLIFLSQTVCHAGELVDDPYAFDKLYQHFYEAPLVPVPTIERMETQQKSYDTDDMPVFKQLRIKFTNYLRGVNEKNEQRIQQAELNALKKEAKEAGIELETPVSQTTVTPETATPEVATPEAPSGSSLELTGGIKEHVSDNDMTLDADTIDYIPETDEIQALGHPVLKLVPQATTMKADKMVYCRAANIVKLYGNVEVIKDGSTMYGDFMQVNLNEETSYADNVKTKENAITLTARKGVSDESRLILEDGKITADNSFILRFRSSMIRGADNEAWIIDDNDRSFIRDSVGHDPMTIKTDGIVVDARKKHTVLETKEAEVYFGEKKLFTIPSFKAYTNKAGNYFEANYPEFGSIGQLGMYAGPGFVFGIPNGGVIKAMPILNYQNKIGVGAALKYKSATNMTDIAYGTAADTLLIRGKQTFDDNFYLQYGVNSYMDDWFLGYRRPKYMVEAVYDNGTVVKDSLAKGLDLRFRHRISGGFMKDSDVNRADESIITTNKDTTRFRYMAEIAQTVYRRENREKRELFDLAFVMQGSAAIYGTGDTQFIGRAGPNIHSQYKNWMQDLGYFISAYQDHTPMPVFDAYRYGHSAVVLKEAYRVNKYVTLAWIATLNLSGDAPNHSMFQENGFFVSLGPDDVKFTLGYDVVRRNTYFTIALAMDAKGSSTEFKKMEIKNPDRLTQKSTKITAFEDVPVMTKPKMQYAQVIDIEDPNKEQI